VPLFAELLDLGEMQFPGAPERVRLHEVVRGLVNVLVTGFIEGTSEAAAPLDSIEAVRRRPSRIAQYTNTMATASAQLKHLLRANVYQSEMVLQERRRSTAKIAEMFDYLLQHMERLPAYYRDESAAYPPHRVVCDYIAGMTDGFFERTYTQLFGSPK
jgi:dGTPase